MRVSEAVAAEFSSPTGRPADAPWTVKAFAAIQIASLVAWVVLPNFSVPGWILGAVLSLAIIVGLLRGYRGAWFVAAFYTVLSIIGAIGIIQRWTSGVADDVVREAIALATYFLSAIMLFHPLTRAWVGVGRSSRVVTRGVDGDSESLPQ